MPEDFLNNKELFARIEELKDALQQTRLDMRKYNGLREDIVELQKDNADLAAHINQVEAEVLQQKITKEVQDETNMSIREKLAWGVSLLLGLTKLGEVVMNNLNL